MELKKILKNIDFKLKNGSLNKNITEVKYDSREIKKDNLFIAISGFKADGHQFIDQAVKNGARTVMIEKELADYQSGVSYIKVENSRKAMAQLA
ncbi:MAG: Mur ligase domain-containing protein, partial [Halanaerobium sp.]